MTARNIRTRLFPKSLPRKARNLFAATLLASTLLLDQTLAVVGHRIITLSEVRGEAAISSILRTQESPPSKMDLSGEEIESTLQVLVQRALINNYLDNLGLITEIPSERLARVKGQVKPHLKTVGISEAMVDRLLTERIRSQIFAEKHLPFRVTVTDQEVRRYYETEKDRKFLREPFERVAPIVRANLQRERVKKELERWLETEKKRIKVVFLNR